jgi:hypothetical protein
MAEGDPDNTFPAEAVTIVEVRYDEVQLQRLWCRDTSRHGSPMR